MIPTNPNYWTKLEDDTAQLYCVELMHTRQKDFKAKFLLVPLKTGHHEIDLSIVCEEYRTVKKSTLQVTVEQD